MKTPIAVLLAFLCGAGAAAAQAPVVNGTLRLQVDTPVPGAIVTVPFAVGGWTIDQSAASGTGIDVVHVYAIASTGAPTFLGAAPTGVARPDVAAIFGAQFQPSGFNLTATAPLLPGNYTLGVFGHRTSTGSFDIVEQVPITVRGVTLSDLFPCTAGQVPQFNGTAWNCADPAGLQGPAGPAGPAGPGGPPGPTGPAGAVTQMWINAWSTSNQVIPPTSDVTFDQSTMSPGAGTVSSSSITLGGTSEVHAFDVSLGAFATTNPCILSLFANGLEKLELRVGISSPLSQLFLGSHAVIMIPANATLSLRSLGSAECILRNGPNVSTPSNSAFLRIMRVD